MPTANKIFMLRKEKKRLSNLCWGGVYFPSTHLRSKVTKHEVTFAIWQLAGCQWGASKNSWGCDVDCVCEGSCIFDFDIFTPIAHRQTKHGKLPFFFCLRLWDAPTKIAFQQWYDTTIFILFKSLVCFSVWGAIVYVYLKKTRQPEKLIGVDGGQLFWKKKWKII